MPSSHDESSQKLRFTSRFLISAKVLYHWSAHSSICQQMPSYFSNAFDAGIKTYCELVRNCILLQYFLMPTRIGEKVSISDKMGKSHSCIDYVDVGQGCTVYSTSLANFIAILLCSSFRETNVIHLKFLREKIFFGMFSVYVYETCCTQPEIRYNRQFTNETAADMIDLPSSRAWQQCYFKGWDLGLKKYLQVL